METCWILFIIVFCKSNADIEIFVIAFCIMFLNNMMYYYKNISNINDQIIIFSMQQYATN